MSSCNVEKFNRKKNKKGGKHRPKPYPTSEHNLWMLKVANVKVGVGGYFIFIKTSEPVKIALFTVI